MPTAPLFALFAFLGVAMAAFQGRVPSRQIFCDYMNQLAELESGNATEVSHRFPKVGLIVYEPNSGFYVGQHRNGASFRGGIGPFKTKYETAMAIWHMEQAGVSGQRSRRA